MRKVMLVTDQLDQKEKAEVQYQSVKQNKDTLH